MPSKPKSSESISVAKYGLIGTITTAIITLIGTIVAAYITTTKPDPTNKPITNTTISIAQSSANIIPNNISDTPIPGIQPVIYDNFQDYTILYPSCHCIVYVDPDEKVLIRLRWGGSTQEYAEKGSKLIKQILLYNGYEISNLTEYRKPATFVKDPERSGDPPNIWWVYWDIPIGNIMHDSTVDWSIELLEDVNTGLDIFPAGFVKKYHLTIITAEILNSPTDFDH